MPKYAKITFQYIELEGLLSSLNFFATFILIVQQVGKIAHLGVDYLILHCESRLPFFMLGSVRVQFVC